MVERVEEARTEQAMRMVLALGPGIGKEHIDRIDAMRRQQIVEGIERFQPQHIRVGKSQAAAFRIKAAHALGNALDAEEAPLGMPGGASRQEASLPAADFDFERNIRRKDERPTGIYDWNDHAVIIPCM